MNEIASSHPHVPLIRGTIAVPVTDQACESLDQRLYAFPHYLNLLCQDLVINGV
jgi:hypothetical protein